MRGIFNFVMKGWTTAEKVQVSRHIDPPMVLLEGPHALPMEAFLSVANKFGEVVHYGHAPYNSGTHQKVEIVFKEIFSARCLIGLVLETDDGNIEGTTSNYKRDKQIKLQTCCELGCNCRTNETTTDCFGQRMAKCNELTSDTITRAQIQTCEAAYERYCGKSRVFDYNAWQQELEAIEDSPADIDMGDNSMDTTSEHLQRTLHTKPNVPEPANKHIRLNEQHTTATSSEPD